MISIEQRRADGASADEMKVVSLWTNGPRDSGVPSSRTLLGHASGYRIHHVTVPYIEGVRMCISSQQNGVVKHRDTGIGTGHYGDRMFNATGKRKTREKKFCDGRTERNEYGFGQ